MSKYKMKEIPKEERPRERFKEVGIENLTTKELLSILLKTGLKNKNVNELSLELLNNYSLEEFKELSTGELTRIKGIGEVKAIELLAAIELGKRVMLSQETRAKLDTPSAIWKDARKIFYGKKQELFVCYYFNQKQELIEHKVIFMGTINQSITHTREIFKEAYKVSASSIVCLHNHPSNDVTPSKQDKQFTNTLVNTGNIQGIPIVDHIIVGDHKYYSFFEDNQINN